MNDKQNHKPQPCCTSSTTPQDTSHTPDQPCVPRNSLMPMIVEGVVIPCRNTDGYYSATAISSAAGKSFGDYLLEPQGAEVLDSLAAKQSADCRTFIRTDHAATGEPQTTWIHPILASQFACWASASFAVMYCDTIWSMMQAAVTTNSGPPIPDHPIMKILLQGISKEARDGE